MNQKNIAPVKAVYFDTENKLPIYILFDGTHYAPVFLHGNSGVEQAFYQKISLK